MTVHEVHHEVPGWRPGGEVAASWWGADRAPWLAGRHLMRYWIQVCFLSCPGKECVSATPSARHLLIGTD